jgi:alpha-D-xyloside xylohydrolase
MKKIFLLAFLPIQLLVAQSIFSFESKIDSLNPQVKEIKNGIELTTGGLNLRVQFYDKNIVRVLKWCKGGTPEKLSLSVIMDTIPALAIDMKKNGNIVVLSSPDLILKISMLSGSIEYHDSAGNSVLKEKGTISFIPVSYCSDSGFTIRQDFQLTDDEGVYGLGQNQDGYFNYRGKKEVLVQSNTNAVIPFLVSTKNYGILWDNYSKTVFNDDTICTSVWSDIGNNIDYYFILGNNMDKVISGYRELTGNAPLYGKWAYGYWQSREHYKTQAEVLSIAEKYRSLKMPIDNIVQDWDYWNGQENWGGMFFDKTLYPDPQKMCNDLHNMHFHIMISIWAALGPNTAVYSDMLKRGYLYKPTGWAGFKYYDAYNPAADNLYCEYLDKGLFSKGLDGWWIDSTEPDVVNAMTKESDEYELKKMGSNYLGSWARYLNPFSLAMTDAVYKNWCRLTAEKRAYILTRSVFAGQQRNAATTWSGDIGASWEIFRDQISAGVNFSMSGVPYWTFDIGGYVLGAYGGVFINGGKDPAYEELYTRMFQFGAFCPIFRSHGSETPREIWEMGNFAKPILKADELRYRLMPYIYSLAWKVTKQDYTIMRGLPMDFSCDKNTFSIGSQFMFGPAIMVCPVAEYMYDRPPEQSVLVGSEYFKTDDGKPGLNAKYYQDAERRHLSKTQIDSNIDFVWYTGRPPYLTDSTYAVTWEGKLIPKETGKHQFHLMCYDRKRIVLNGDTLKMAYTSVEQYTEPVNLIAGKEYDFLLETENTSTGAARVQLFWKTPSIFANEEEKEIRDKEIDVYLPSHNEWYDFWTGVTIEGGKEIKTNAPIDIIPLFVKAGSIVPMGPFIQYSTEKHADPIELRIYRGADGTFTLYEDENDNYDYEKGIYSTIDFNWDDSNQQLTISTVNGKYPGMLKTRTFDIVLVSKGHGAGVEISGSFDKVIHYSGEKVVVQFNSKNAIAH